MARVLVVSSHPPFAEGGHLVVGRNLVAAFEAAGHRAELMLTPQNRFGRQGAAYLATWLTDVGQAHDGHAVDLVVSLRYPSYAVRHPRHVCWLNHTMREYYDLWDGFAGRLSWRNRLKEGLRRRVIHTADRYLLTRNVDTLFVQSATVNERLAQTIGVRGQVLHPPAPSRPYRCEAFEPYVLTVSRLIAHKRVDLLLRALAHPLATHLRAEVIGDGDARGELQELARTLGVADRVRWWGHVDEATLLDRLARCRVVCFTPASEDYGFVAAEAAAASKPLVTCHDSGGPVEIVEHNRTGAICAPDPAALAAALADLMANEDRARSLGAAAKAGPGSWTWSATVAALARV